MEKDVEWVKVKKSKTHSLSFDINFMKFPIFIII
tara:strand:+ start:27256 stop:27357 length:102 start_codon:yes stop_codon:yes gene_type:complete